MSSNNSIWFLSLILILSSTIVLLGHYEAQNKTNLADSSIKIMPLGNSITAGKGSTNHSGYRRELYKKLVENGYDIDFVGTQQNGIEYDFDRDNEGHAGWFTDDPNSSKSILNNIYNWLDISKPDIILLHIGTNDISNYDTPINVSNEISMVLDEIDNWENDNNDDIIVLIAKIIRINPNGGYYYQKIGELNEQIDQLVNNRKLLGDNLYLTDIESSLNYQTDMTIDNYHPNDLGYTKMANKWYSSLIEVLKPDTLFVNPDYYNIPSAASSMSITIESNTEWNIVNNCDWITLSSLKGIETTQLIIDVEKNLSDTDRIDTLFISTKNLIEKIIIEQQKNIRDSLILNTDYIELNPQSDTINFEIVSNTNWEIIPHENWLTVNPTYGFGNAKILITYPTNNDSTERISDIEIVADTLRKDIIIKQKGFKFYHLRLLSQPSEGGIIYGSNSEYYREQDTVSLIARPYEGWDFEGWLVNGIEFSSDSTIFLEINNGYNITALFSELSLVDVNSTEYSKQLTYELKNNYPNPFNPTTTIYYSISNEGQISLEVYDILGNKIAVLENAYKPAGQYSILFDGSQFTSGIYYYTIKSGDFRETKKMLLVK